jgi:hypothetical protein
VYASSSHTVAPTPTRTISTAHMAIVRTDNTRYRTSPELEPPDSVVTPTQFATQAPTPERSDLKSTGEAKLHATAVAVIVALSLRPVKGSRTVKGSMSGMLD